jgi:acyl-CoA reductase-like NAD-dependent aldehyde dehydrogenase
MTDVSDGQRWPKAEFERAVAIGVAAIEQVLSTLPPEKRDEMIRRIAALPREEREAMARSVFAEPEGQRLPADEAELRIAGGLRAVEVLADGRP